MPEISPDDPDMQPPKAETDSAARSPGNPASGKRLRAMRKETLRERLADALILNPMLTRAELGETLGISERTVSLALSNDDFQEYFRSRRRDHFYRIYTRTTDKLAELANATIETIVHQTRELGTSADPAELRRNADMALRYLGYGIAGPPDTPVAEAPASAGRSGSGSGPVTVNVGLASPDDLRAARAKLLDMQQTQADDSQVTSYGLADE